VALLITGVILVEILVNEKVGYNIINNGCNIGENFDCWKSWGERVCAILNGGGYNIINNGCNIGGNFGGW